MFKITLKVTKLLKIDLPNDRNCAHGQSLCYKSGFVPMLMCKDPLVIPMSPGDGRKGEASLVPMLAGKLRKQPWDFILQSQSCMFTSWNRKSNIKKKKKENVTLIFFTVFTHISTRNVSSLNILTNVIKPLISLL